MFKNYNSTESKDTSILTYTKAIVLLGVKREKVPKINIFSKINWQVSPETSFHQLYQLIQELTVILQTKQNNPDE